VAAMTSDERKPRRSRSLTADEHALWSHVTRSIAPLRRARPQREAEPVAEEVEDVKETVFDAPLHSIPGINKPRITPH